MTLWSYEITVSGGMFAAGYTFDCGIIAEQEESPGVGASWAFVLYRLDTVILLPIGIIAYTDLFYKIPGKFSGRIRLLRDPFLTADLGNINKY